MAIGPITVGATRPSWVVTILRADNTALDITGATFTGCLYELRQSNRLTLTPGNYSITNATSGIFTYAPVSADVAVPGTWQWETVVTISAQTYVITVPNIQILGKYAA